MVIDYRKPSHLVISTAVSFEFVEVPFCHGTQNGRVAWCDAKEEQNPDTKNNLIQIYMAVIELILATSTAGQC